MNWYGLTKEEVLARCADLGLRASFSMTLDPKLWRTTQPGNQAELEVGIEKVVRAVEQDGVMRILLGCFAEGTVIHE